MRYERVQEILESDAAFRARLGPKDCEIATRFGATMCFSKEVVEITEALHNEGKDAHKVPKNEVLHTAMMLMRAHGSGASLAASPFLNLVSSPVTMATLPPGEEARPVDKSQKNNKPVKLGKGCGNLRHIISAAIFIYGCHTV